MKILTFELRGGFGEAKDVPLERIVSAVTLGTPPRMQDGSDYKRRQTVVTTLVITGLMPTLPKLRNHCAPDRSC